ncbi:MAG: C-GCAxxG-C-C family protein [Bacteroidota bacterium]|nr:C-GCAxxG-C-C family protein [Bacteroidota bacterium]
MSEKSQQAVETFGHGYNCAQSVLSVFAEDLGMNRNASLKLASPFGAGISYMQETCGAVTGALMAIGLKYGKGENGTDQDKMHTYNLSRQLITEFKGRHGTLCCRQLLDGLDMSTPEGMAKIRELDLFHLRCTEFVKDAVEIAEKIIEGKAAH